MSYLEVHFLQNILHPKKHLLTRIFKLDFNSLVTSLITVQFDIRWKQSRNAALQWQPQKHAGAWNESICLMIRWPSLSEEWNRNKKVKSIAQGEVYPKVWLKKWKLDYICPCSFYSAQGKQNPCRLTLLQLGWHQSKDPCSDKWELHYANSALTV